jgi:protease II
MIMYTEACNANMLGIIVHMLYHVETTQVARSDWPNEWHALFPTLMTAALIDTTVSNDTVVIRQQSRALSALHQTLKELSTKKFGFDKRAFAATVNDSFGPLKQLWTLLCTQMLTQQQTLSIDLIKRVTVCLKVLHRMMILGMPQLAHPEAPLWLQQILTHMQVHCKKISMHNA